MILYNPVVVSVGLVLLLSLLRTNVVIALTIGAIVCGVVSGLPVKASMTIFASGLGGGAKIAISYAVLGAFASALSHSGIPSFLLLKLANALHLRSQKGTFTLEETNSVWAIKCILFLIISISALACKNIIPVHVAFVPILIPPLLGIFNKLQIDRRIVSCIIACGVIVAYLVIPMGFGEIFLVNILLHYLQINGITMTISDIIRALMLPVSGLLCGLAIAFYSYGKSRVYSHVDDKNFDHPAPVSRKVAIITSLAVIVTLVAQVIIQETIFSALLGFLCLSIGGAIRRQETDSVAVNGFKMMSLIAFTMVAAAGFGQMLRESGGIALLVDWIAGHAIGNKPLASFAMLFIGFLISVGIGSAFSTVPIVASVYVPLGLKLGFSPAAIAIIIVVSGVTGDSGSPASGSLLGATIGLNADGQHAMIRDTVVPAFFHLTIPVFLFGWVSSLVI